MPGMRSRPGPECHSPRVRIAQAAAALLVLGAAVVPVPAAEASVRPCSRGLVALTFDDGPAPSVTPRLVRILVERHVPATFFMLGSRVRADPADARLVSRHGFVVGNHTWTHRALTTLGDDAVRAELSSTQRELDLREVPRSRLMRPPYGATNARVDRIARSMGLVPVLWTIDTRDWAGGTSSSIAHHVLGHLRAHRPNIVLQHDGVRRSPTSVAAVPRIVSGARKRGYCFTSLDRSGHLAVPVPTLRFAVTGGREAGRVPVRVQLTLDRPTTRRVSVRLATAGGSARSQADFSAVATTVVFPAGSTRASVVVPVVDDRAFEPVESFTIRLAQPSGLRLGTATRGATIVSNDAKPPPPPPPPSPPPPPPGQAPAPQRLTRANG
jgi:peptidoglycan/xylan/chitin deacetylase (PgdA/CDA1 family)